MVEFMSTSLSLTTETSEGAGDESLGVRRIFGGRPGPRFVVVAGVQELTFSAMVMMPLI